MNEPKSAIVEAPKSTTVEAEVMAYAVDIARTLHDLRARKVSYGEFYISRVVIAFEGEDYDEIEVGPTEHDALGIKVTVR